MKLSRLSTAIGIAFAVWQTPAGAVNFSLGAEDAVTGSFDSTISLGGGIRAQKQAAGLITQGNVGGPPGELGFDPNLGVALGPGDQGNLNYKKGDFFTQYLKGSHELLLKFPSDIKFMARANWVRDFAATNTTGYLSATSPPGLQDGLADDARKDARFKARLLDFWVSKTFEVEGHQVRARLGNQVISWGESLFQPGGINATNAFDIQRLAQPGTQLKEAVLPAPMLSVAANLGHGINVEAYKQFRWNSSYFPPTGTYWSTVNGLGRGHDAYGISQQDAKNAGQWGASVRWQPEKFQANFGAYVLNYHDKTPNFTYRNADFVTTFGQWKFAENRRLYGVSANVPVGDWALGGELSYRPRDAVTLNGLGSCNGGTECWVDEKRYQAHFTALFSATPNNAKGLLDLLKADTATFLFEAVAIRYPKLQPTYNNGADLAAAGGWAWTQQPGIGGNPVPVGTKLSGGYNFDFSWVYDGTLIPGWQVTPGVYFFHAVKGRTPNASAQFMKGAKSANFYVNFTQNPADWQAGLNYARFWGGSTVFDQPLKDRAFFGAYVSRNF